MKKFLLAMCLFAASASASAQSTAEMLLWDDDPGVTSAAKTEAIRANDFTRDPAITVYVPEHPNGTTIIMCPGGGYAMEAMDHEGHDMAPWLNGLGVTYVVLKYRLPQGDCSVPLADAEQAIRLVRAHAGEWGVDPARVGIMGASAGGHLATTLATRYSSAATRPDFQVLLYPVVTMDSAYTHLGSRINLLGTEPSPELVRQFSAELNVTPDTPKAFIALSSDDKTVPVDNSLNYYRALLDAGVGASLHAYPTGGHGWGYHDYFIYKPQWKAELEKWLAEELRQNP